MLTIVVPDADEILALQDRERALYYSIAAEDVLRREGLISIATDDRSNPRGGTAHLLTRDVVPAAEHLASGAIAACEGPLSAETLTWLGLAARTVTVRKLRLHTPDRAQSWLMVRPAVKAGKPAAVVKHPRVWTNPRIAVQVFKHIPPQNVLLHATLPNGKTVPAVFHHNGVWISALPVFDLIGQHFAFPPLVEKFSTRSRIKQMQTLSAEITRQIADVLHRRADAVSVICDRWRAGYASAFTVRHDYDRAISQKSHDSLLALYERLKLKCSTAWLGYLAPAERIRDFAARGHEIQVHAYEKDAADLAQTLDALDAVAGSPVRGATIHGGHSSIGFRGDRHFVWLEALGLDYVESFSVDHTCAPVYRPDPSGILRRSRLMATPVHASLDDSIERDTQRSGVVAEQIRARLEEGGLAIAMNHPDLNREVLVDLVEGLPRDGVWCATLGEICDWERASKYEPVVTREGETVRVQFARPLPHDAMLHLRRGQQAVQSMTVRAGTTQVTVSTQGVVSAETTPVAAPAFILTPRDGLLMQATGLPDETLAQRSSRIAKSALFRARRLIRG